jgi:ABC-type xylose transport system, permease component
MTTITRAPAEAVTAPKPPTLAEQARAYWQRLRGGEMGSFPAVLAIIVLVIGFGVAKPVFLTPLNFANLLHQSAVYIVAAMALVFVLLIGEIDLAAGWTAGVTAAVMAKLLVGHTVPWYLAILASIVTGVAIGTLLGTLVAKLGVPSFVVTLAAFLAFQGVLLWLVDQGQVILITDPVILAINNNSLPIWAGWALYAFSVVAFAAVQLIRRARRARRGVSHDPMSMVLLRIGVVAAIAGFGVYALSVNRSLVRGSVQQGVPIVVPIVVVLLVVLTFVLKRTRFGLHLYALGGNAEAARRAGIPVDRLKIAAFALCSTLAAMAGIIQASRSNSVDGKLGSQLILFAVGAAVIGGTSLFGGRGRIIDAVLGGLVVAIIANGMGLLSAPEWVRFVVTGLVLLVAAAVDALARKRSSTVGLR